jgi:hypothetical protein
MTNKKAYLIKGGIIEFENINEWIERITTSQARAKKITKDLNSILLENIIEGREVFDRFIKPETSELEWGKMEFFTEKMNDDEYTKFCNYRYGKQVPFKIAEVELS